MFFILRVSRAGKTLESLTVDGEFLYWISSAKDSTQIYQAKKSNGTILSQVGAQGSKRILAYSSVLQPFPGNKITLLISMFSQLGGRKGSEYLPLQAAPASSSWCSVLLTLSGWVHAENAVCPGSQLISMGIYGLSCPRQFKDGSPCLLVLSVSLLFSLHSHNFSLFCLFSPLTMF